MRILIYGFGPYRQYKENITEKIVRSLPARRGIKKTVFPVRFNKSQFLKVLRRYRPDVVLGLGQCSSGRRLRIERRAVNKRRENRGERPKPVVRGGARWLTTNLTLGRHRQARFSNYAGDYVCNYSMYVILNYLKRKRLPTRFGFVHVPHDYSKTKAKRFLRAATKDIWLRGNPKLAFSV